MKRERERERVCVCVCAHVNQKRERCQTSYGSEGPYANKMWLFWAEFRKADS